MKNKVLIFIVGLFAGVVLGALFSVALKELVVQFEEVHLSLNKINLKQNQLSQRLDSIQGKLVPDTKRLTGTQLPQKVNAQGTSTVIPDNEKTQPEKTDDSTATAPAEDDSNIVVMTNQLISVMDVSIKNKDTASSIDKKTKDMDSTLSAMSDVTTAKDPLQYRIEFWKSPLNYKGYKMSRGKIILYGLDLTNPVNLTMEEGSYYLFINQSAYKVCFTDDYKPFDKITDKPTLKKLGYED